jgi:hypothetical protein
VGCGIDALFGSKNSMPSKLSGVESILCPEVEGSNLF